MKSYINSMPLPNLKQVDIPSFMKKYYQPKLPSIDSQYIQRLIDWAEREFMDVKNYYIAMQNEKAVCMIIDGKLSFVNVIAHSKAFKIIKKYITDEEWSKLPSAYKNVLIQANEILGA